MSDIQLAVLLAASGGLGWFILRSFRRESGHSGVLQGRPAPDTDTVQEGLRFLLFAHGANLVVSIPILAPPPFSFHQGHAMAPWLAGFLGLWLSCLGLTQLVYIWPLRARLSKLGHPVAARSLLLAAGMTLAVSGLFWARSLRQQPAYSVQAAAGLLALACAVALLWLARELRRHWR